MSQLRCPPSEHIVNATNLYDSDEVSIVLTVSSMLQDVRVSPVRLKLCTCAVWPADSRNSYRTVLSIIQSMWTWRAGAIYWPYNRLGMSTHTVPANWLHLMSLPYFFRYLSITSVLTKKTFQKRPEIYAFQIYFTLTYIGHSRVSRKKSADIVCDQYKSCCPGSKCNVFTQVTCISKSWFHYEKHTHHKSY